MKTGFEGTQRLHDTADFERHYLSNGITVWLQKPNVVISYDGCLSIFFRNVGSANDPIGLEGMAHFLEHMLFRSSFSCNSESEVKAAVLKNGGEVNARTNTNFTEYYVQLNQEYFPEAIKTLHAITCEPVFKAEHVVLEHQIILNEMGRYRLHGDALTVQHLKDYMFGKNNPYTHFVSGYPSSIKKINPENLFDFYQKNYHAGNANIVVGGSFSCLPNVLQIIEQTFGGFTKGISSDAVFSQGSRFKDGRFVFSDKRYNTDSFSILYPFPYMTYEERVPLDCLINSLAGSSDAPVNIKIRELLGLTYHIDTIFNGSHVECFLGFESKIDASKFNIAQEIFMEELSIISENRIINYVMFNQRKRLRSFMDPISSCRYLPVELGTFGRTYAYREMEKIDDSVELNDVFAWRDKILNMQPLIYEIRRK